VAASLRINPGCCEALHSIRSRGTQCPPGAMRKRRGPWGDTPDLSTALMIDGTKLSFFVLSCEARVVGRRGKGCPLREAPPLGVNFSLLGCPCMKAVTPVVDGVPSCSRTAWDRAGTGVGTWVGLSAINPAVPSILHVCVQVRIQPWCPQQRRSNSPKSWVVGSSCIPGINIPKSWVRVRPEPRPELGAQTWSQAAWEPGALHDILQVWAEVQVETCLFPPSLYSPRAGTCPQRDTRSRCIMAGMLMSLCGGRQMSPTLLLQLCCISAPLP